MSVPPAPRAVLTAGVGVVRCALVVRLLDEWWSYLPAGTIDDQVGDLGLSYGQSGWLLALLTLGGLLGSPVAALADRGHRRLLATSGALVIAAGLSAFALAAPFPLLVVAATLLGGASDLMIRPLESSLADAAGGELDRLLGRQHLLTWAGDFVAPALLGIGAATVIGWRGVFTITLVVFVAFALRLATTEFPPPVADPDGAGTSLMRSARSLLRRRELWLLTAAEFALLPLDEAFLGFAVARAAAAGNGAAAQLLAGGVVAGGLVGAAVVSRRGLDRRLVAVGCGLLVVGAGVTAAPLPIAGTIPGLAFVGLGTAIIWAKVHHRTLTLEPSRSATVPTMVSLLSTPALLVPVAMGVTADRLSITAALVGAAVLAIPLAAVVLALGGGRVEPAELDTLDD
ncbi:MAG: MFS transporter [Acidimicrobiales bacterium]|nr:MFS transporter [Acidimicrobiales bacterium]MCB9392916.1 MFS transporter [Acidimicrobiaceae bacterium]